MADELLPVVSGDLARARALLAGTHAGLQETMGERTERAIAENLPQSWGLHLPNFLSELFRRAGYDARRRMRVMTRLACEVGAIALCTVVFQQIGVLFLLLPVVSFELLVLERKARERTLRFDHDYAAMLLSLASAVRTGLDPLVALGQSYQLFPEGSPMRDELIGFKQNIDRGIPEELALREFGSQLAYDDLDLFRSAITLARRQGSSLGIALERLARVTRQRQSFRRKVKAAIAMQKLSAIGIAGCAVSIMVVQFVGNPQTLRLTLAHPVGSKLLGVGGTLVVVGLLWMTRIARSKV
jgi:Flp pilus assembly protein TadB